MSRPADVVAGQRLGPYELVRELGRGGFASVWLAKRAGKGGFEVSVAIKIARREESAPLINLLDEARAAVRVGLHPNILPVYEAGELPG